MREGKYREALRRIVAEADGNPERIVISVLDWIRREGADNPDLTLSVLEEFGEPAPDSMIQAVTEAFIATHGDAVGAVSLLNELSDERENPTVSSAIWDDAKNAFIEALKRVLIEELARYEKQRPQGDICSAPIRCCGRCWRRVRPRGEGSPRGNTLNEPGPTRGGWSTRAVVPRYECACRESTR